MPFKKQNSNHTIFLYNIGLKKHIDIIKSNGLMRFKNCRQPSWEFRQTASLKRGRDVKDHELSIQPRIYFEFQFSRLSEAERGRQHHLFSARSLTFECPKMKKTFPFLGQAGSQLTSLLALVFRIFWTTFIWIKESGNFWPEKRKFSPRASNKWFNWPYSAW